MRRIPRIIVSVLAAACPLVITGCGSAEPPELTDEDVIVGQVTGLNDVAGDETAFAAAFVSGAAPADGTPYTTSAFEPVGSPSVSGDTATVKVKVISGLVDSQQDDRAGSESTQAPTSEIETTWTLQRDGDEWKLKEAPLQ